MGRKYSIARLGIKRMHRRSYYYMDSQHRHTCSGTLFLPLADKFHLIAPDYPGFGYNSMPSAEEFQYTFDHLAEIVNKFIAQMGLERFSMYVMDYGAPIGYRLAVKNPEKIEALIVQNGNAYDEGLGEFWEPLKAYWSRAK